MGGSGGRAVAQRRTDGTRGEGGAAGGIGDLLDLRQGKTEPRPERPQEVGIASAAPAKMEIEAGHHMACGDHRRDNALDEAFGLEPGEGSVEGQRHEEVGPQRGKKARLQG